MLSCVVVKTLITSALTSFRVVGVDVIVAALLERKLLL